MTTAPQHAPGDRVRIQHDPRRDAQFPNWMADRRRLAGQIGTIRERRPVGLRRVVVPDVGQAWFACDELAPEVEPPVEQASPAPPPDPLDVLDHAVQQALHEARRAQGELAAVRAERDALKAKLGAAEEQRDAWRHRALIAEATLGTAQGDPSAADYVNSRARDSQHDRSE